MRILLDTHALLWWLAGSDRLSKVARGAIADDANDVLVSAGSAWEIATKYRLGRLPGAAALAEDVSGCLLDQGFRPLAITVADGERAGRLPGPVRDPFDRMLIAQALTLDIALVSIEQPFDRYGVRRLW
ncbi:MAG: type II toxin-antitoxin system VapC family toxin [Spirochaetaceae bacterium]|nr:type II toxin-antitoxin system VapC family toxin [Spirochaetaceae bacterium]